ncbi:hypothetical protein RB623_03310 [Mesorhizobium sp. LHD-90]|uniref:hypothetical protein n=1 Tax=Mesorhizobium sp. LHD-90 TaxID=3071414 RepID=UPI0027E0F44A|nr:hypothetical protein [Mesorhizobium sp. LHD-90]MDQ6433077.1 hypothetical protein [Mesorhizobium sp. LHD-90]
MKIITVAILAASLALPSMALAQSSTGTANEAATTDSGPGFWTGAWMRDFFTDDSMATVKPSAEAQAAFAKMTPENQAKLKAACESTYDRRYSDICEAATM